MAGRPKMMANKITELEAKMEEVFNLIDEYIPRQYEMHEGPLEKTEPLCQCWNMALFKATDAMFAMSSLAEMLRAKAGIPEQRENPQAVACCERGTNGDAEPVGAVDIPS